MPRIKVCLQKVSSQGKLKNSLNVRCNSSQGINIKYKHKVHHKVWINVSILKLIQSIPNDLGGFEFIIEMGYFIHPENKPFCCIVLCNHYLENQNTNVNRMWKVKLFVKRSGMVFKNIYFPKSWYTHASLCICVRVFYVHIQACGTT